MESGASSSRICSLQHISAALRHALGCWLVALMVAGIATNANAQDITFEREDVVVETSAGSFRIDAEIADTGPRQRQGLMFRETLAPNSGMLFDFRRNNEINMWMRNTKVALDMVFIKPDGRVHRIEHRTTPLSDKIISSQGDAQAVLELKAGTAKAINLKQGDLVRHAIFGNAGGDAE